MSKYSIQDINEGFYEEVVDFFKESYRISVDDARLFNVDATYRLSPVKRYCPAAEERIEFPFPLAYDIRIVYQFVKGEYDVSEDIEESMQTIIKLINRNPWTKENDYELRHDQFINLKIGFLIYLAQLKLRLLNGDNFSAVELGTMIGITGQGIVNRIKRGQLEAHKEGNEWVINNSDARRVIEESSDGIL